MEVDKEADVVADNLYKLHPSKKNWLHCFTPITLENFVRQWHYLLTSQRKGIEWKEMIFMSIGIKLRHIRPIHKFRLRHNKLLFWSPRWLCCCPGCFFRGGQGFCLRSPNCFRGGPGCSCCRPSTFFIGPSCCLSFPCCRRHTGSPFCRSLGSPLCRSLGSPLCRSTGSPRPACF